MKQEHKDNLRALSIALINWDEKYKEDVTFDMSTYADDDHMDSQSTECGSVGCAIGHAPYCGLPAKPAGASWEYYSDMLFGDMPPCHWRYLFGSVWSRTDYNNRKDTGERIAHYLDNDCQVPADFDATDSRTYTKYW